MIKRSAEIQINSNINAINEELKKTDDLIDELVKKQSGLDFGSEEYVKIQSNIDELNNSYNKQKSELDKLQVSLDKQTGAHKSMGKSMLDNGGAMGILNDLTGGFAMTVKDGVEASELFKGSMKGWKAALLASGIGLLVVALGTIIAYWDDIKGAVNGVSSAQKELLATAHKNADAEKEKLDTLNSQDNILKLQGKSEKEILQMKVKQGEIALNALNTTIKQEEATLRAEIAASERNKKIMSNLLQMASPITMAFKAVIDAYNFISGSDIKNPLDGITDKLSSMVFDTDEVKAEGTKVINELKKQSVGIQNTIAGQKLAIKGIEKQASDEATAKAKEKKDKQDAIDKQKQAEKEANDKAYNDYKQNLIKETQDLEDLTAQQKLDRQKQRDLEEIAQLKGKSEEEKNVLRALLDDKYKILQKGIDDEEKVKKEAKDKDIQNIIDGNIIKKTLSDAKDVESLNAIYTQLQKELDAKQAAQLKELTDKGASYEQINALKETHFLQDLDLQKQFSDSKDQLDKLEEEKQVKKVAVIGDTLATASKLLGEHTMAGKLLAISAATIDTYQSSVSAYKGMVAAIPGPVGVVAGGVAAAGAIASGLATVKKIVSVKVPGKGGGASGGASGATPAVTKPSVSFQSTQQGQISNTIQESNQNRNSQPIKTYVTLNDVNNAQSLQNRIDSDKKF